MKKKMIVAVSGGPDSMALLHMLFQQDQSIIIAHVNYHQRETSQRDENTVKKYAYSLGIPFEKKDFDLEVNDNFQKMAREFRYSFFKELYEKYDAETLFLGHHLDDDLETYIMQKKSKRETDYPGINKETIINGMRVKRPLLKTSKKELIDYCIKNQIPYEIDETNLKLDYTRNKVRNKLEKLSPKEKELLIQELYQSKMNKEKYMKQLPVLLNPFKIKDYKKYEKKIRLDALRNFLERNGVEPYTFSRKYLEELDSQILGNDAQHPFEEKTLSVSHGEVMLHGDLSFSFTLDKLRLLETEFFKLTDEGKTIEGVSLTEEDFPITIRSPKKGDAMKLRFGTKSLNRFFIDRKIPIHQRLSWPIIENSKGVVIFVVGLGCDIHHFSNNPSVFMLK